MINSSILAVKSILSVFKNINYVVLVIALAGSITLIIFFISILALRYELLIYIFTSDIFTLKVKMQIFLEILLAIRFSLPTSSIVVIVVVSSLLAVDISLLVFYLKKQVSIQAEEGVGLLGLMMSILGVGCSTCGTIVLSSVLGFTMATVLISLLPLAGLEFGIAGISLLLLSIYLVAIKIQALNSYKAF